MKNKKKQQTKIINNKKIIIIILKNCWRKKTENFSFNNYKKNASHPIEKHVDFINI